MIEMQEIVPSTSASIHADDRSESGPSRINDDSKNLTEFISRWKRAERLNSELLDAAVHGDTKKCIRLLNEETQVEVNTQCRVNGVTPVIVATSWGHEDLLKELINFGADITITDYKNRTALHFAAANGSSDILKTLFQVEAIQDKLKSIVNVQIKSIKDDCKAKIVYSWNHKHSPYLLQQSEKMEEGRTALHLACHSSHYDSVKLLLDNGANPRLEDHQGLTALDVVGANVCTTYRPSISRHPYSHSASSDEDEDQSKFQDTIEIIRLLLEKIENPPATEGEDIGAWPKGVKGTTKVKTFLHTAVKSGNIALLKSSLLRNEILYEYFHVFDKNGFTPLHKAVIMKRLDIVEAILENGKEDLINILDSVGSTPLFLAMMKKWFVGIDYFLENGCSLSSSHDNSNVFHVAARLGYADMLSEFLQLDQALELVNSENKYHQTPLWLAVKKSSSASCVKLLLKAGAKVSSLHPKDGSLLHAAIKTTSSKILRLLLEYGGRSMLPYNNYEGMTSLQVACRKGLLDCVKELVEYGSDVKAKTEALGDFIGGGTSLHLAARYGHLAVVEYLLQQDKSLLNIPNRHDWYPLHVATRCGMADCVQYLIAHGADVSVEVFDHQTGSKHTALDLIVDYIPQPKNFLQHILDSSIDKNTFPINHPFCMIKCKHNILIPQANKRQLSTIVALINKDKKKNILKEIILHPLNEIFLFHKWQKLRVFFMSIIMVYVTFTVSFTALTMTTIETFPKKYNATQNITSSPIQQVIWSYWYFLLFSNISVGLYRILAVISLKIIVLLEICHALILHYNYFLKIESWLKATIIILTVWALLLDSDSNLQTKSSISAVIILCSWSELLFIIACLPNWGYSILMFRKVARDVIKVLMTFSCLIFGFTYTFMVIFQLSEPFATFSLALLKILAMMSEYDYGGTFIGKEGQVFLARAIFISFVVLVSIVMMNLMIGIAVSDIAVLKDHGRMTRLVKQIEFLYLLESFVDFIPSLIIMPKSAERALEAMCKAPTELIFRPGKPLCNLTAAAIPPNLLDLITDKAVEISKLKENKIVIEGEEGKDKRKEIRGGKRGIILKASSPSSSSPSLPSLTSSSSSSSSTK